MKVGIIGLGYIGSVTAACLAEAGYEVVGVDVDESKVNSLLNGAPIVYEPNLKELLDKNKDRLYFSTDYISLKDAEIVFIVVGTPTKDKKIYLKYVEDAVLSLKNINKNAVIVIKSTVLPGTAKRLMEMSGMKIISNPEFTKEGSAIEDTLKPDRVVIGGDDKEAVSRVKKLWDFTNAPILETTNENAEMIKYASNSFLAVKISFINEIANLCEKVQNCDVDTIAKGMGFDKRIAPYFLKAGIGFGGSCFPKDTTAFISFAEQFKENLKIVKSALEVNDDRIKRVMGLIKISLEGKERKKVGILGLTFKANTNDTRASQAIKLAEMLNLEGYTVNAYDPMANININWINRYKSALECVENSDLVVIATEWDEFKNLNIYGKKVIDMKGILNKTNADNLIKIGVYG